MTAEQRRISDRNRRKAWKHFVEIGIIDKNAPPYTYAMHHKDETLRHNDIERYILWLFEDLEVEDYGKHTSHHHTGLVWSEESREKMRGEKNPANLYPERNNFVNNNPALILIKGTHYYNNGFIELRAKECPEGFVKGRLPGCFGRKAV